MPLRRTATNASIDPAAIMQRVAEQALLLVPGADGALIGVVDGDELAYICGSGFLEAHLDTRTGLHTSIGGLAVRTGTIQRSDDTDRDPRVDRVAAARLGTRSTVCVPLSRGGGAFGVLAVGSTRRHGFDDADVDVLASMADVLAVTVGIAMDLRGGPGSQGDSERAGRFLMGVLSPGDVSTLDAQRRVEEVLDAPDRLSTVFQPIVDLRKRRVVAVEALTRFGGPLPRTPDVWFAEAHQCGLGVELELLAFRRTLAAAEALPAELTVTMNVGPEAVLSDDFCPLVAAMAPRGLVLELTEHTAVADYPRLVSCLHRLRRTGVRLAVDDTGSGYSGLTHLLKLAPDFIKLDRDLTAGIDIDPVRRALAASLVTFAAETGSRIVAEGVETRPELDALMALDVEFAQGYFLGRPTDPASLPDTTADLPALA